MVTSRSDNRQTVRQGSDLDFDLDLALDLTALTPHMDQGLCLDHLLHLRLDLCQDLRLDLRLDLSLDLCPDLHLDLRPRKSKCGSNESSGHDD